MTLQKTQQRLLSCADVNTYMRLSCAISRAAVAPATRTRMLACALHGVMDDIKRW